MPAGGADDGLPYIPNAGWVAGFFLSSTDTGSINNATSPSPSLPYVLYTDNSPITRVVVCSLFLFFFFFSFYSSTHIGGIDREPHDM